MDDVGGVGASASYHFFGGLVEGSVRSARLGSA